MNEGIVRLSLFCRLIRRMMGSKNHTYSPCLFVTVMICGWLVDAFHSNHRHISVAVHHVSTTYDPMQAPFIGQ